MSEKKYRILRIFFLVLIFLQIFYIYQFRSGFNFEIINAGGITYKNFNELHSLIQGKYYHGKKIIKIK